MKLVAIAATLALVGAGIAAQPAHADSSCWYSLRGCVSVQGYYRQSGTYVRPYYRNYPGYGYRSYSYPSYRSYSYPSYRYRSSYSYPSYRSYGYPSYRYRSIW
jgi:hypothetical protein